MNGKRRVVLTAEYEAIFPTEVGIYPEYIQGKTVPLLINFFNDFSIEVYLKENRTKLSDRAEQNAINQCGIRFNYHS